MQNLQNVKFLEIYFTPSVADMRPIPLDAGLFLRISSIPYFRTKSYHSSVTGLNLKPISNVVFGIQGGHIFFLTKIKAFQGFSRLKFSKIQGFLYILVGQI